MTGTTHGDAVHRALVKLIKARAELEKTDRHRATELCSAAIDATLHPNGDPATEAMLRVARGEEHPIAVARAAIESGQLRQRRVRFKSPAG